MRSFNGQKTHCPQGHPYDEQNTAYTNVTRRGKQYVYRTCRKCHVVHNTANKRRKRANRSAPV